jgi:hypothetical protein
MTDELPSKVRVGYRDFAITTWAPAEAYVRERAAECDKFNLIIRVRADLPPSVMAECLLHEVIHAAYEMAALERNDDEERVVTGLTNQLSQIWRDNPELVAYLSRAFGR